MIKRGCGVAIRSAWAQNRACPFKIVQQPPLQQVVFHRSMITRPLLMVPGPIEFSEDVLHALSLPTLRCAQALLIDTYLLLLLCPAHPRPQFPSHVSPEFIDQFGQTIERLRAVFVTSRAQPFVLAGSGKICLFGWLVGYFALCHIGTLSNTRHPRLGPRGLQPLAAR